MFFSRNPRVPALASAFLYCLGAPGAIADTFYVAPGGSDSATNPGTDIGAPLATIQEAANRAQPGDTVQIRTGVYRELVSLPRSGTPGNPIVFQAFNGENVTVTATDVLTGFTRTPETNDNANVYVANLTGSTTDPLFNSHELTVFVDGQLVQAAKSRNSADYLRSSTWATVDSNNGTSLTDSALRNLGDLTGGFIRVRTSDFAITNRKITAYDPSAGTVTLSSSLGNVGGRHYLAHDARSLVDSPGEWYFDEENGLFYLWAPDGGDPDNYTVEVKRRPEAFDTNGNDYLHFRGLRLTGGDFDTAVNSPFNGPQSDHLLIENVHITGPDRIFSADFGTTRTSLNLSGNNNIVRGCEFEQIWSAAIRLRGNDNQVVNNFFHDASFNGGGSGGIATSGDGQRNLISHNTFTRMGRSAIVGLARRNLYQYNDFSEVALITEDTGAVYAFNSSFEGSVFRFNTFHDISARLSTGFYVDNFVTDVAFHNNVTWNADAFGYKANQPNSFILHYNNTAFDSGRFDIAFPSFDSQYGSRFYNNIASSLDPDIDDGSDPTDSSNNFITSNRNTFVSVTNNDFRLRANAGARGFGRPIPGIAPGPSPDAGAYPFGAAPFSTGHDFSAQPTPTYDLTGPVFGGNRITNGSFEHGLDGFSTTGTVSFASEIASNLRDSGLVRYGRRSAILESGEAVSQLVTGLEPETAYTLGVWAKPVRLIVEAESLNPASTRTTTGNVRGQTTIGPLRDGDVLIYDGIDFGDGTRFDQLTLQIAATETNERAELRLGSPTGTLLGSVNLPSSTGLVRSSAPIGVSGVSGVRTIYLVFSGDSNIGQLESLRFTNTADKVTLQASGFGSSTRSLDVGSRVFAGPTPRLTFVTGSSSTSATVSVSSPPGAGFESFVDYLSLFETDPGDSPAIAVDTTELQYNYDLGTEDSPLFPNQTNGFPYRRVSPATAGGVSWTGTVGAVDRGILPGVNQINRDFVSGTTPAIFNHTVANGRYLITLNMSDPTAPLDNLFVSAEGVIIASNIDRAAGQTATFSIETSVSDGELNLRFGDADTTSPRWVVSRIIVRRIPSGPPSVEPSSGALPPSTQVQVTSADAPVGTVHYTTDGSDPRNGAGSPPLPNPFSITRDTRVIARSLVNGTWSARTTVDLISDRDADGLPNFLELQLYGDETGNTDGTDDFDGDGTSDSNEWIAGTSLTDPSSVFAITGNNIRSAATPGDFLIDLEWASVPGRTYMISTSTDLEPDSWTRVATGITASSATTSRTISASGGRVFVRVEVHFP